MTKLIKYIDFTQIIGATVVQWLFNLTGQAVGLVALCWLLSLRYGLAGPADIVFLIIGVLYAFFLTGYFVTTFVAQLISYRLTDVSRALFAAGLFQLHLFVLVWHILPVKPPEDVKMWLIRLSGSALAATFSVISTRILKN